MKIWYENRTEIAKSVDSFKKEEAVFAILNLFVLALLILIHTAFASKLGNPPKLLIVILVVAFLGNLLELIWVQGTTGTLSERTLQVWTSYVAKTRIRG